MAYLTGCLTSVHFMKYLYCRKMPEITNKLDLSIGMTTTIDEHNYHTPYNIPNLAEILNDEK